MEKLYLCCNLFIWWLTSGEINADYVLATFLLDSVPNCPNYARAWWQYSQINMVVVYLAVSWSYHKRKCLCKISICVTRVFCCSECPQWLTSMVDSLFLACSHYHLNVQRGAVWLYRLACSSGVFGTSLQQLILRRLVCLSGVFRTSPQRLMLCHLACSSGVFRT